MRIYRIRNNYQFIKIFDPYTIAILLALRKVDEANIGDTNRLAAELAFMQVATTARKLEEMKAYNLVEERTVKRAGRWIEKRYRLTEKGRKIADTLYEALIDYLEKKKKS